jgi:hypothetical protein
MAKDTKKPTITSQERAVKSALRIAYEVRRYEWLSGDKPMTPPMVLVPSTLPLPKPTRHQNNTLLPIDRAKRAIREFYKDGTDGVSTAAVTRRLAIELMDENKQLGVKALSYDTVARALGRR